MDSFFSLSHFQIPKFLFFLHTIHYASLIFFLSVSYKTLYINKRAWEIGTILLFITEKKIWYKVSTYPLPPDQPIFNLTFLCRRQGFVEYYGNKNNLPRVSNIHTWCRLSYDLVNEKEKIYWANNQQMLQFLYINK